MKLQLLTVFSLLQLSAGDPPLVCQETVKTRIGDNVTLPCHVEPEKNIEHEAVEVTKVDPDALVLDYYNGRQFAKPYRHRTFLNTKELKSGVVNLTINSVRKSDEGTYRIHISTPTKKLNSTVTLIVGNPLLVCQETVEARIGDNVTLTCQLEPKQNIENETIYCRRADSSQLVYTYSNRKQLPDQEDQYRYRTSLDFEGLKIGVLKLTINSVRKSDNGTYQFYIHTWEINSTVTLIVGDPPPSRDHLGVLIGVSVVGVVLVVVLIWVKRGVIGRLLETAW